MGALRTPAVQTVREILLRDWDPLGIGDNISLADEYDSYIPTLLNLLTREPAVGDIIRCLEGIEAVLGGTAVSERRLRAAWRLLETFRRCAPRDFTPPRS